MDVLIAAVGSRWVCCRLGRTCSRGASLGGRRCAQKVPTGVQEGRGDGTRQGTSRPSRRYLGISEESVRGWKRQADIDDVITGRQPSSELAETARLRPEKRRVEMGARSRRAAPHFASASLPEMAQALVGDLAAEGFPVRSAWGCWIFST